ncbi:MAG: aminotransferase class I/II-fold pyridoxal phosphate-dependent enzyme [Deltaproteobacteria bacterium]|nr:aminotransferase class I/II-fold pyridoxal phosphate-dependent enzyme [Deltaproteobacteria bacterium]NCP03771.1 aminotransferase class I/II-fold pyridoxal phosphate-dependent enzyme [Deltaproteobacteria bacterium]NCP78477.1 aminotransferase class I/II-fold pyridoxal phosphate-dependent enzyme [Desulfuromonadales bacterium]
MGLFDKLANIAAARQGLEAFGVDPFNVVIEEILSPTEARIGGQPVLLAGTNNYLGLTFDPGCMAAACQSINAEGTGTTGSRMANGTYAGHLKLEEELATFYDCRKGIVFSTGFLANLGMITALAGPGDAILIDADCHASIYDGCRMSGADIIRFRHNSAIDMEKKLKRLGARTENTLIIVEGIYSMLGDRAPLKDIVALKRQYGGMLMVDEAHSLGVLGEKGRGMAEDAKVEADVDFIVGTFSKSLGGIGGFCVGNHPGLDLIPYASRPYIFTASPSPATIASTRAALPLLRDGVALRKQVWENATSLYTRLQQMGFKLGPEISPVIAVRLGAREESLAFWQVMLNSGVYVNLVLPPAAPSNSCLLRCSLSAAHTPAQIEKIAEVFSTTRAQLAG